METSKKEDRPSPAHYETSERWKKLSQQKKTKGTYTYKEDKITFVTEAVNIANEVPASNKYDKIPLDTYLERTMYTKIPKTNFPRFQPIKRDASPAPTSYATADAIEKNTWSSTRYSVGKDKKVFI